MSNIGILDSHRSPTNHTIMNLLLGCVLLVLPFQESGRSELIEKKAQSFRKEMRSVESLNLGPLFSAKEREAIVESVRKIYSAELDALSEIGVEDADELASLVTAKDAPSRRDVLKRLRKLRKKGGYEKLAILHGLLAAKESCYEEAAEVVKAAIKSDETVATFAGFQAKSILSILHRLYHFPARRPGFTDALFSRLSGFSKDRINLKLYAQATPLLHRVFADPGILIRPLELKPIPVAPAQNDALIELAREGKLTPMKNPKKFSRPEVAYAYFVGRLGDERTDDVKLREIVARAAAFDPDNSAYDFALAGLELEEADKKSPDPERCRKAIARFESGLRKTRYETYAMARVESSRSRHQPPFQYGMALISLSSAELSYSTRAIYALCGLARVLDEEGKRDEAVRILDMVQRVWNRIRQSPYVVEHLHLVTEMGRRLAATATDIDLPDKDPLRFYQLAAEVMRARELLHVNKNYRRYNTQVELMIMELFLTSDEMAKRWQAIMKRESDMPGATSTERARFEKYLNGSNTVKPQILGKRWEQFQRGSYLACVREAIVRRSDDDELTNQVILLGYRAMRLFDERVAAFLNDFKTPLAEVGAAAQSALRDLASDDAAKRQRAHESLLSLGARGLLNAEITSKADKEIQARLRVLRAELEDSFALYNAGAYRNVDSLVLLLDGASAKDVRTAVQEHLERITGRPKGAGGWPEWWKVNKSLLQWDPRQERLRIAK